MFMLLDRYLLGRAPPPDDLTVSSRRIDGDGMCTTIYFLPWNTPFWLARRLGLINRSFLACYELAPAMLSSEPVLGAAALLQVTDDAEHFIRERGLFPSAVKLVGYSLGSYPATLLANRLKARLYAVAPADRGDLMVWQSPATRGVRERAKAKGFGPADYARAMRGLNPVDNLNGLGVGSTFIVGHADPFVPETRVRRLVSAVRNSVSDARVIELQGGHVSTLLRGAGLVRRELSQPRGGVLVSHPA